MTSEHDMLNPCSAEETFRIFLRVEGMVDFGNEIGGDPAMSAKGKCLCGAVTFTAEEVESHMQACHCSMCRNWSGGPFLAASVGKVDFSGEEHIKSYRSSDWAERGFCAECGTNLFYHLIEPSTYVMCIGAFDDADQFSLAGEIYIDEKPKGYDFAGDHERLTGEEFMKSIGMGTDGP